LPDAHEWLLQDNLRERVQMRAPAALQLDLGLKKKIQLAGKRTLRSPRSARHRFDAP
jgi:hypothetical protein